MLNKNVPARSKSFPPSGGMTCSVEYKILIRSSFRIEIFEDKISNSVITLMAYFGGWV